MAMYVDHSKKTSRNPNCIQSHHCNWLTVQNDHKITNPQAATVFTWLEHGVTGNLRESWKFPIVLKYFEIFQLFEYVEASKNVWYSGCFGRFKYFQQGNYSLRRPPKLITPQAVITHWEKMSFCMHIAHCSLIIFFYKFGTSVCWPL